MRDGPHPTTTQAILGRVAAKSQPGDRADDYRIALAVEGGGMRTTVSAGMLLALEQLGFSDCFDLVVGSSAGTLAGAFFVTDRATAGAPMFYTDLNTSPFLDKMNALQRRKVIDIDYLIDTAAPRRGLNLGVVDTAPIELWTVLCPVSAANGKTLHRVQGSPAEVADIVKAAVALPVLAGKSREVAGEGYVDGGLIEQVPWRAATELGATHVLVLPSRLPANVPEAAQLSRLEQFVSTRAVARVHGSYVAHRVATQPESLTTEALSLLAVAAGDAVQLLKDATPWDGHLELVAIDEDAPVPSRFGTDSETLVNALSGGMRALVRHLGLVDMTVEQRVVLDHPSIPTGHGRSDLLRKVVTASLTEGEQS